jgi:hypothetical protein
MAEKKRSRRREASGKQRDGAPAVVENPDLPRMGEIEVPPSRMGRRVVTMPDEPLPYRGTRNLMDPVPRGRAAGKRQGELGDQEEPPARRSQRKAASIGQEGYVRLRIRVEHGELSVAGATFVEGPLAQPEMVHPGLSYEVKVGRRRVAVGDVPDPEWRSYPDPSGRPGLEGHHITEPESYEFTVRMSAAEFTEPALAETNVALYRWTGEGPGEALEAAAIARQPKGAVTRIGVLRGIDVENLPGAVQKDVRRAIR